MTGSSHSAPPPLSRSQSDRDDLGRRPDRALTAFASDPATRVVLVSDGRIACRTHGSRLALFAPSFVRGAESIAYLGTADIDLDECSEHEPTTTSSGRAFIVQHVEGQPVFDGVTWCGLRQVGELLNDRDAGFATQALAIVNWHTNAGYCSVCGGPTAARTAGWSRVCSQCDTEHFPRTDPAVIVAVHDARERILLGSNAQWDRRRFSLLAGFVEAGESAEAAVVREIGEEAGIPVVQPEYLGSQPWPFPRSLMLGYRARLEPGTDPDAVIADGDEIIDLRWFTRDDLTAAVDSGEVEMPGRSSIARWILDEWLGDAGHGSLTSVPRSKPVIGVTSTPQSQNES